MQPRQPELPSLWMMTDERQGEALWAALRRLPPGSGIVFRHKSLLDRERRRLFERVRRITRRRGLILLLAGDEAEARRWGADGAHHRRPGPPRAGTAPAHNLREIRAAERSGAAALLLSPLHPTRSHPGAPTLGRMRFAAMARATRLPVIALGGIDRRRGRAAMAVGAHGWAAIDAWTQ
ncbi:thiamine monophosphate synthase [Rhizorhabdus wittichii RW1]|uniref:Thiamine monophosphate synthase n=1 Tax=Rhizorhabdus wittichii (strain DSM 6014 / CCUG 31198 / JCM 15750 / NBRC 105917 / EY 4224 / RW1) TaxID=392499 RepID=A0A9J9HCI8_RHIWR|nr:thiamine monophosphate synthase [Rhizorhabdus wittichii RW1]